MLLIIFLKFFRVGTEVDSRGAPVGIEGLQLLRPIILAAVVVDGDLPKVQLLKECVLFYFVIKKWYLPVSQIGNH